MNTDIKELFASSKVIFDIKHNKNYFITKLYSEQKVNHCIIVTMLSTDLKHKQQFSNEYFLKLVKAGQLIIE